MIVKKLFVPCLMVSVLIPSFDSFATKTRSQEAVYSIALEERGQHTRPVSMFSRSKTVSSVAKGGWSTWSRKKKVAMVGLSILGVGAAVAATAAIVIPRMMGPSGSDDADLGNGQNSTMTFPAGNTTYLPEEITTTAAITSQGQSTTHLQGTTIDPLEDCFDSDGFLKDNLRPDFIKSYVQENHLSKTCEEKNVDYPRSMFFSENFYKMGMPSLNQTSPCKTYLSGEKEHAYIAIFYKGNTIPTLEEYQETFRSPEWRKIGNTDAEVILRLEGSFFFKERLNIQSMSFCQAPTTAEPRSRKRRAEAPIPQQRQIGGYDVSWTGAASAVKDEFKKSFNASYNLLKDGVSGIRKEVADSWNRLTGVVKRRIARR